MQFLPQADIDWQGEAPASRTHGDVYFSRSGGPAETHHVFLGGIGAPDVWQGRRQFSIGELGFGTGLNFLVTVQEWLKSALAGAVLDYWAVDNAPLSPQDRKRLETTLPEDLRPLARELYEALPPPMAGNHVRWLYNGRVRLVLALGDAIERLAHLTGTMHAWYLDGFAPRANAAMWDQAAFRHIARCSRPGVRLATFTAAGAVRRGLEAAGFACTKVPGYGRKREQIAAVFRGTEDSPSSPPKSAAVIGAGIAGAALAHALALRRMAVTVFDAEGPKASGNPAAMVNPKFALGDDAFCRLHNEAFFHAMEYYGRLQAIHGDILAGPPGILEIAEGPQQAGRMEKIMARAGNALPGLAMGPARSLEAGLECSIPALMKPGLTVRPAAVREHLLDKAEIRTGPPIEDLIPLMKEFDRVIIAAGAGSPVLAGLKPPLRWNRGQLSVIEVTDDAPPRTLSFGHYLTGPFRHEGKVIRLLGASYERYADYPPEEAFHPRETEHRDFLNALAAMDTGLENKLKDRPWTPRVALRLTSPDHLPCLRAPTAESPGILTALGSTGFQTAPLLADQMAAAIASAPGALDAGILKATDPDRFRV